MSQLRQQADAVRRQGAQQRRDWNPSADSAHYKIYRWWHRQRGTYAYDDNFCHYWRVVLIWAPLRWFTKWVLTPLFFAMLGAALALLGYIGWHYHDETGIILGIIAGIVYLYIGMRVAGHAVHVFTEEADDLRWKPLEGRGYTLVAFLVLLTLPACIIAMAAAFLFGSLMSILLGLEDEHQLYSRVGKWFVSARFSDAKWISWLRPVMIVPAALVALSLRYTWAQGLLAVVAFVGVILGFVTLISYLADKSVEHERALRLRKENEKIDQLLRKQYAVIRPERAGNEVCYQLWLKRYRSYFNRVWGPTFWTKEFTHRDALRMEREPIQADTAASSQPGPLSRIVTAAVDLFAFLWSVVLVNKWKICPIVELPPR